MSTAIVIAFAPDRAEPRNLFDGEGNKAKLLYLFIEDPDRDVLKEIKRLLKDCPDGEIVDIFIDDIAVTWYDGVSPSFWRSILVLYKIAVHVGNHITLLRKSEFDEFLEEAARSNPEDLDE